MYHDNEGVVRGEVQEDRLAAKGENIEDPTGDAKREVWLISFKIVISIKEFLNNPSKYNWQSHCAIRWEGGMVQDKTRYP